MNLFNEAEVLAAPASEEPQTETITYSRKKWTDSREAKLENFPVDTGHYELPEEELVCGYCGGELHPMSTETPNEITVIPAEVRVLRHVRQVYACRRCEREEIQTPIVTAPMPKSVYPGSLASSSILAHVMNQKYVESQPLYRQEQQFARMGLTLSRQTLANWMIYGADQWLTPLFERMKKHLLKQDVLHADETTLQVLREPGKSAESQSYLWLYRTGRMGPPSCVTNTVRRVAGSIPETFWPAGYHKVAQVTLVGCWAHARRKFDEALEALPTSEARMGTAAQQGLTRSAINYLRWSETGRRRHRKNE